MSDNENKFITKDKLNGFGKLDYSDVINQNQRSDVRAMAWGKTGNVVDEEAAAFQSSYKNAFAEHMAKTDEFMNDKFGRGDSTLMAEVKVALNEVNKQLCISVDTQNKEHLEEAMQYLAACYNDLISACQNYIREKDRFYRKTRGKERLGLVRSILYMAVKERGEFTDSSVINFFAGVRCEGIVLGNLLGYRTTVEESKTREEVLENNGEIGESAIYDLEDEPALLEERSKTRVAASRLFSALGCSNLCTNTRIAGVRDKDGKIYLGTRSEKFKGGAFESGYSFSSYRDLKGKTMHFSAEAMSDLSSIKLMNFLLGGSEADLKDSIVLRYRCENLDGQDTYIVTGAHLLQTAKLLDEETLIRNIEAGKLFKDRDFERIPKKIRKALTDFADSAFNDAAVAGGFINFYFSDLLDSDKRDRLSSVIRTVANALKEYENKKDHDLSAKEAFENDGEKSFLSEIFDDDNCIAEWDVRVDGHDIPDEKKDYFSTYRTYENELSGINEDQEDNYIRKLSVIASSYMQSKETDDQNMINEHAESARIRAMRRLLSEELNKDVLTGALSKYTDLSSEVAIAYRENQEKVKDAEISADFNLAMVDADIYDDAKVLENLALCLTLKSVSEKISEIKKLKALLVFAQNQKNQRFTKIRDEYMKGVDQASNKLNAYARFEEKYDELSRNRKLNIGNILNDENILKFEQKKKPVNAAAHPENEIRQKTERKKVTTRLLKENMKKPLEIMEPDELQYDEKVNTDTNLSIAEVLNSCHKTAEARVDYYMGLFDGQIQSKKNEKLDEKEPDYVIEVPDKKFTKDYGEPTYEPLFGENGNINLKDVRENRSSFNCYIIAAIQSLARYNPDYITKHLIKEDPRDPKWAIVTLFDEAGRKQKIRVQKTKLGGKYTSGDERPVWIQCVEKACLVLIGKKRNEPAPRYRFWDDKEKGGHDYSKYEIADESLNADEMAWGSEQLASWLLFGEGRFETISTRNKDPENYTERSVASSNRVETKTLSKTLIDNQGDIALAKALTYFKMGYAVICNTAEEGGSTGFYDKLNDTVKFPVHLLKRHEFVFCGEGTPKNGQRTVKVQSAYEDRIDEYTFGEFKHCFTSIHVMPNKIVGR